MEFLLFFGTLNRRLLIVVFLKRIHCWVVLRSVECPGRFVLLPFARQDGHWIHRRPGLSLWWPRNSFQAGSAGNRVRQTSESIQQCITKPLPTESPSTILNHHLSLKLYWIYPEDPLWTIRNYPYPDAAVPSLAAAGSQESSCSVRQGLRTDRRGNEQPDTPAATLWFRESPRIAANQGGIDKCEGDYERDMTYGRCFRSKLWLRYALISKLYWVTGSLDTGCVPHWVIHGYIYIYMIELGRFYFSYSSLQYDCQTLSIPPALKQHQCPNPLNGRLYTVARMFPTAIYRISNDEACWEWSWFIIIITDTTAECSPQTQTTPTEGIVLFETVFPASNYLHLPLSVWAA